MSPFGQIKLSAKSKKTVDVDDEPESNPRRVSTVQEITTSPRLGKSKSEASTAKTTSVPGVSLSESTENGYDPLDNICSSNRSNMPNLSEIELKNNKFKSNSCKNRGKPTDSRPLGKSTAVEEELVTSTKSEPVVNEITSSEENPHLRISPSSLSSPDSLDSELFLQAPSKESKGKGVAAARNINLELTLNGESSSSAVRQPKQSARNFSINSLLGYSKNTQAASAHDPLPSRTETEAEDCHLDLVTRASQRKRKRQVSGSSDRCPVSSVNRSPCGDNNNEDEAASSSSTATTSSSTDTYTLGDGQDLTTRPRRKLKRTQYSKSDLQILNAYFNEDNWLSPIKQEALATEMGYSDVQIKTWFQNKRASIYGTRRPKGKNKESLNGDSHKQSLEETYPIEYEDCWLNTQTSADVVYNKTCLPQAPADVVYNKTCLPQTAADVAYNNTCLSQTTAAVSYNNTCLPQTAADVAYNNTCLPQNAADVSYNKTCPPWTHESALYSRMQSLIPWDRLVTSGHPSASLTCGENQISQTFLNHDIHSYHSILSEQTPRLASHQGSFLIQDNHCPSKQDSLLSNTSNCDAYKSDEPRAVSSSNSIINFQPFADPSSSALSQTYSNHDTHVASDASSSHPAYPTDISQRLTYIHHRILRNSPKDTALCNGERHEYPGCPRVDLSLPENNPFIAAFLKLSGSQWDSPRFSPLIKPHVTPLCYPRLAPIRDGCVEMA